MCLPDCVTLLIRLELNDSPLPTMVTCVPPLMLPVRGHMYLTLWAPEIKANIGLKLYTNIAMPRLGYRALLYNPFKFLVFSSSYCSRVWGGGGGRGPVSSTMAPARMFPSFSHVWISCSSLGCQPSAQWWHIRVQTGNFNVTVTSRSRIQCND